MRHFITSIIILLLSGNGFSQDDQINPPSLNDESEILTTTIPASIEESEDYQIKYFQGTTGDGEIRFLVNEIGYVVRPFFAQVYSADPINISFVRSNWDESVQTGKTKNGEYETSFKAAESFGIKLDAAEPDTEYFLAVAFGQELNNTPNIFYPIKEGKKEKAVNQNASTSESEASPGKNNLSKWLLIVAIIIALLLLFILRKLMVGKASILIILLSASFIFVSAAPIKKNVANEVFNQLGMKNDGKLPQTIFKEALKRVANHWKKGGFDNPNPLSPKDKNHEPDIDPRGQPKLPSSCIEAFEKRPNATPDKNNGCDCLRDAYEDFNENRYLLAKLQVIGSTTKKFTDEQIAFGDNFSGVHALSGLAWQKQRVGIMAALDDMDAAYKAKFLELSDELYKAMIEIDRCEALLGNNDWYSQSGFMYYEFAKLRYETYY